MGSLSDMIRRLLDSARQFIKDTIEMIQQYIRRKTVEDILAKLRKKQQQLEPHMDTQLLNQAIITVRDILKKGDISKEDVDTAKQASANAIGEESKGASGDGSHRAGSSATPPPFPNQSGHASSGSCRSFVLR